MFACILIYCTLLPLILKHGWLAIFVLTKYSPYSNILNKNISDHLINAFCRYDTRRQTVVLKPNPTEPRNLDFSF